MENHEREPLRFLIMALIYFVAAAIGGLVVYFLPLSLWLSVLIADVIATVVIFLFSAVLRNASAYDPYWSVQPIVIVIGLACIENSFNVSVILAMIAIFLWGVRLTANWAYTFKGLDSRYEDWRYRLLAERTGGYYVLVNFFGIHLVPTLIVYACMLPVIFTFYYAPAFNAWSAVFFAVSVLAILLEGLADCTMHKFKKEGGEGFLRKNVWKYSRHPNYLGEILFWWGVALAAVCLMPELWWLIAGAAANTLLFLFVSIPLADGRQARKPGFALYKKNTRMLLPLYKRQREETAEAASAEPAK